MDLRGSTQLDLLATMYFDEKDTKMIEESELTMMRSWKYSGAQGCGHYSFNIARIEAWMVDS